MKTITFKKTLNGNYVSCILPIVGQQSSEPYVYVFDKDFNYIKTVEAHPLFTWVACCKSFATIGGLKNTVPSVQEALKKVVENNFEGYTTSGSVFQGNFNKLLPPLNSLFK